jgi:hypothetical protein
MINDKLKTEAVPCEHMFYAFGEQIKQTRRIAKPGGLFFFSPQAITNNEIIYLAPYFSSMKKRSSYWLSFMPKETRNC